ncbi:MAG: alpha/beta hydrolase [Anaerolineaceae bacterium]|nr:MAG: alpha/beta hydrolase [Anaerolineaceae bacterium]
MRLQLSMSAITVDGDLVHYEVLGRGGRPVILLHGWIGSWRYWIPTMRLLQLKFRVYALDLFGYGDSSKNTAKYNMASQMRLLDQFMKQLGMPKAAILAHGYGAQVALNFAAQYPERVARLMLISAPIFDPGDLAVRVPPEPAKPAETQDDTTTAEKTIASAASRSPYPANDPGDDEADKTLPSSLRETIRNPNAIDRAALRRAAAYLAEQRRIEENKPSVRAAAPVEPDILPATAPVNGEKDAHNPLESILANDMEGLLGRCFRKSETEYDKLYQDIAKCDNRVLRYLSRDFSAGRTLDAIRLLPMPTVVVHGADDPLIPLPDEAIWDYVTQSKEDQLVPIPLVGVRHFPMLEHETFQRLVGMFLETADISKIELKERWRRRSR